MDIEIDKSKRAVVLLASYDAPSLYLTVNSLSHTLDEDEIVVVILNGRRGIRSAYVEDVARNWVKNNKNKFVVRPLNYGNDPYNSIKEILTDFKPLKNIDYICKIDDDLIPLKKGWLNELHLEYLRWSRVQPIGFVTSLINNNTWGFSELLNIFDKWDEYKYLMNYKSDSGEGVVLEGEVSNGVNGTVWQYPYLAKWCHSWTTLDLNKYVEKTSNLEAKIIPTDTHYSIGCIFFRKELWNQIQTINKQTNFDELSLHIYCKSNNLAKVAVMTQPMVHLFYFVQRKANNSMLPLFAQSFSDFWKNDEFLLYPKLNDEDFIISQFEEFSSSNVFQDFNRNRSLIKRSIRYIKRKFFN